jgi:RsiW-degrading membrane proteinase PrsW (M82 family)
MPSFEPLYLLYGGLALVPAIIWLSVIFRKQSNKKIQILMFFMGAFSVAPIFLIQYLFTQYPQLDFISHANNTFAENPHLLFMFLYAWVSISEELVKQWMVRYLDSKYLIVQTINDSIRLSLISALGFSFAENIFYLYYIGTSLGVAQLLITYLFRSIFTTCGHLVFSGFFGYFYGIAKFSISIVEQSKLQGKYLWFSQWIGRVLNISRIQAYQETTILKGLLLAILLHTIFNYSLEMSSFTGNPLFIGASAVFILLCYLSLRRLLKHKSSKLVLIDNHQTKEASSMAKDDEEVVIELLGMWFKEKKYVDVLHICERLLKRDPTNRIINLFKAKAIDQMGEKDPYKKILPNLFSDKDKPQK